MVSFSTCEMASRAKEAVEGLAGAADRGIWSKVRLVKEEEQRTDGLSRKITFP